MKDKIVIGHGSGGRLTRELVKELFLKNLYNPILSPLSDSAVFNLNSTHLAVTTDSYVIRPVFFQGRRYWQTCCRILGLDPLYIANEGKAVIVAAPQMADKILYTMKSNTFGINSSIIGEITGSSEGVVFLKTLYGSHRIIDMPIEDNLPRIC